MNNVKRRKVFETSDEEDEDYFCVDIEGLKQCFSNRLEKFVNRKQKRKFRDELAKLFRDAAPDLEELCDVKPSDRRWKLDVDTEKIPVLEQKLKDLRSYSRSKEISIVNIVEAQVNKENRSRALQLFDVLNNVEPYTKEWFEIKDEIGSLLKPSVDNSYEQRLSTLAVHESKSDLLKKVPHAKREWYANLPYEKVLPLIPEDISVHQFLKDVKYKLDLELYGLEKVKEELLMLLNNRIRNPFSKSSIGLCGPPGVGKTSIAKAFSRAVGLPYERIALGGSMDSTLIKGADSVWTNSHPSILISFLRRAGCANGIVLFDEIDKLSNTHHGMEVQSSLLEITDYTQNNSFKDAYLSEISHDLSMLWFMFSMNSKQGVNKVLLDRIKVINIPAYTQSELLVAAKNYVFPRIIAELGAVDLSLEEEAYAILVSRSISAGMRRIEDAMYTTVSRFLLNKVYHPEEYLDDIIRVKDLVFLDSDEKTEPPRGMYC